MRLIDETAYQYKIAKIPMEERTFVRAWETAQNMPTIDAVSVVRCRDCKYYGEYRTNKNKQIMRYCMRMAKNDMEYHVKPEDYCSYGEKMEDKT